MSFSLLELGTNAESFESSGRGEPYDGVIITVATDETYETEDGEVSYDISYSWPIDTSGCDNIFRCSGRYGSTEIAKKIFDEIVGKKHTDFTASNALLDPAAEIGDWTEINGVLGVAAYKSINYSALMAADIESSGDSELDHEYDYTVNHETATANEVKHLKTSFTVRASEIIAVVEQKADSTGGDDSTFSYVLSATQFLLKSNDSTVFKCDSSGVEITGKVTATSGEIGGCAITNGVLEIASANITSLNASVINAGTISTDRFSSATNTGISGGYSFSITTTVTDSTLQVDKTYLKCNILSASSGLTVGTSGTTAVISMNGHTCTLKSKESASYVIGY